MVEEFRQSLYNLSINNSNLEEIKDMCEEMKEMIDLFEFEHYDDTINQIARNYKFLTSKSIVGDLVCVSQIEEELDRMGYYIYLVLDYKFPKYGQRGVRIEYGRKRFDNGGGESVEVEGPHFSPTEEEAPELYDDFLRWLVHRDFSQYVYN